MMRINRKITVALAAILLGGVTAFAQPKPEKKGEKRPDKMEMMTQQLDLSATQVEKIEAAQKEMKEAGKAIRQEKELARCEKQVAAMKLREEYNSKIKEILSKDQYIKLLESKLKKVRQMEGRKPAKGEQMRDRRSAPCHNTPCHKAPMRGGRGGC